MMSQESLSSDLLVRMRALLEAVNRGDFDAMMSFVAPDAVFGTRSTAGAETWDCPCTSANSPTG